MDLFNNVKYVVLIFIITLILGYYLGLLVSTVVDYRLKDAVVHMPRPKNNIIIEVSEKPNSVKVKDNSRRIENFTNFKSTCNHSEKKERFISSSCKKKIKKNITIKKVKSLLEKVQKQLSKKHPFNPTQIMRDKYYLNNMTDKKILEYAQNVKNNIKIDRKKRNEFKSYIAYNYEDMGDNYTNLDKNGFPIDENRNKETSFKSKSESNLKSYDKFLKQTTKRLPKSDKLCPDFKCQRNYMTCTSNHIPKMYDKKYIKDVKQLILN